MQVFSVEEAADDMFENFKRHHKKAEQDYFVERGNNQGPVIKHLGKPHILTQQDHLGQHECLDQRKPVMEITNPHLRHHETSVRGEDAEEQGQVQKDRQQFLYFVDELFLQAAFFSFVPSMSYPLF